MAFLRRLSDSLWNYVSPLKTDNSHLPTPKSAPTFKKPAIPNRHRRTSTYEISHQARSMSPNERVGSWRIRSPSSQASSAVSREHKRKRQSTASPSAGRRHKRNRLEDEDMGYDEFGNDYDTVVDEELSTLGEGELEDGTEYDAEVESVSRGRRGRRRRTTLSVTPEVDTSLIVDEYAEPTSRRIASLPAEHRMRDISDDELRAKGWDDDYITLVQKVALRGYEPLLPSYLKFDFRWLPTELFEDSDDSFIGSVRGSNFKTSKVLETLFQLGGRVRDRIDFPCRITPERQMRLQIKAFNDWAQEDAGINQNTAIPVLTLAFRPGGTDPAILINDATKKCRRLAARYREALQVQRSVELSPEGSDHTLLSYPLPTFYAIIGSDAKLALMAYDPKKGPDEVCEAIAFFDFDDVGYDVWNSLALAIAVCHARNVQMMIAEETGVGSKQPELEDEEMDVDDPDA